MAADQLHLVGTLLPLQLDGYRFCFGSEWTAQRGKAPTTPERFLASGVEENAWRLRFGEGTLDVSQWETPKRTRTYPLARVYRLLQSPHRRGALIPAVKDEGSGLNPDVLGLDTLHLLTLFGVYAVVGHYLGARGETQKRRSGEEVLVLRDQRLDFEAALTKLEVAAAPEVSVVDWNRGEVDLFAVSLERSAAAYRRLHEQTGVPLTTVASCERRLAVLHDGGLPAYVRWSDRFRLRSQHAETVSVQPKEHLVGPAAKVLVDLRLDCDLGAGEQVWLHLAPDEGWVVGNQVFVLEKKANPSENDLLGAIFKNMAFRSMKVENVTNPVHFGIGATYETRTGACWSLCPHLQECLVERFSSCRFQPLAPHNAAPTFPQRSDCVSLLREGAANGFLTFVVGLRGLSEGDESAIQRTILSACGVRQWGPA
ncbi:MAG: hypothetical protein COZ06_28165 [Armatimonadetes bacterium CG_4_10_14_3_um_filter_66_18]|nr:hypothetical protein [Armatimonadota bacterium]OIO92327.1 MAG: hypothetical protein AUJ96_32465 [Armatimonadetes bacterium CG2_30_66_41]PIU92408.1 MAG: hypothetical protein COS65_18065 [Armatimonadetes bacterium CG06_land_8_20_14_3_00_66_21]PIX44484.1 MAG: hypothetical protein COZ57_17430 [Armatimonadetes bacterium CG_4_8_14_3_um_filter_66_20]PIY40419.1 MAG: hypothetical protein COZ06_28165 [Armatimonadetes bacterium CG_4_10_14_3_um_filter_66_18]PIZ32274.1 MAG: hypothetical protein COY42_31